MTADAIRSWFDKAGIKAAPGVEPVETETRGIGLKSSRNCKEDLLSRSEDDLNELVLATVPSELIICRDRLVELANEDDRLRRWLEPSENKETEVLHRGILYLWLMKKNNIWKDYLNALPMDIGLPFSYNIGEMQDLDLSAVSLHHAALMKRLSIEKSFERFMKTSIGRASGITLQQWLTPYTWISSRGLTHPRSNEICLVPLIDLCNHASESANVRYEVNASGDFELRAIPGSTGNDQELLLDYGGRSAGEFVFNYGFFPNDRNEQDFDEVFKVFDPTDDEVSALLSPAITAKESNENAEHSRITYETLLEFFEEEFPQVLRITRLPQFLENDESKRYRFHNNFIMALACSDKMKLTTEDGEISAIYLGSEKLSPKKLFETVLALDDAAILQKARKLVAKLCRHFTQQIDGYKARSPTIAQLAQSERSIFETYASLNA